MSLLDLPKPPDRVPSARRATKRRLRWDVDAPAIRAAHAAGESPSSIAERLNTTRHAIYRVLQLSGRKER